MMHAFLSFAVTFALIYGVICRRSLTFWALHAYARLCKGKIITTTEFRGGQLREYESGYVEFFSHGCTVDCVIAERLHVLAWQCVGAGQGGCTGGFFTPPLKQKAAEKYVSARGHSVEFVDPKAGLIVYRDRL